MAAFELTHCVLDHVRSICEQVKTAARSDVSSVAPLRPFLDLRPRFPSILHAFRHFLQESPDKVLYTCLEDMTEMSFADVAKAAFRIANRLSEYGVSRGDRILLVYPLESASFPMGLFGCFLFGAIAVPIAPLPPNASVEQLQSFCRIVAKLDCRFALTDTLYKVMAMTKRAAWRVKSMFGSGGDTGWPDLTWISTNDRVDQLLDGRSPHGHDDSPWRQAWQDANPREEDTAYLQFTSGSTSEPRGVVVHHSALAENLESILVESGDQEVSLGWVPAFHDMCLVCGLLRAAYSGTHFMFYSPRTFLADPASWLRYMSQYRVQATAAPNFGYEIAASRIDAADLGDLDLSCLARMHHLAASAQDQARCGPSRTPLRLAVSTLHHSETFMGWLKQYCTFVAPKQLLTSANSTVRLWHAVWPSWLLMTLRP
jgi:acyl-CoA synthetase (AMP-forming)/AMP-acid ligase II